MRGALSLPCFILGWLQKFDRELHMGAASFTRLFNEAAHNRPELRGQLFLQVLVTLPRP